jgi:sulfotransferase family protein
MPPLNPSPVFVVGAPRSGTTYLATLLNQHERVHITNEAAFMIWEHLSFGVLPQDSWFVRTTGAPYVQRLRAEQPDRLRAYYRTLAPNAVVWGDKHPHYIADEAYADSILELFPQAKFIHIVRDGRDCVASILAKGWVGFHRIHRGWRRHVENGHALTERLPSDQVMEFRYEDLVADDEAMAARVLEFLGLDLTDSVREFCRRQQVERTPISLPTRDLAGAGVRSSRWEQMLSPHLRLASFLRLRDALVQFGYETPESAQATVGRLTEDALLEPFDGWPEFARDFETVYCCPRCALETTDVHEFELRMPESVIPPGV